MRHVMFPLAVEKLEKFFPVREFGEKKLVESPGKVGELWLSQGKFDWKIMMILSQSNYKVVPQYIFVKNMLHMEEKCVTTEYWD